MKLRRMTPSTGDEPYFASVVQTGFRLPPHARGRTLTKQQHEVLDGVHPGRTRMHR